MGLALGGLRLLPQRARALQQGARALHAGKVAKASGEYESVSTMVFKSDHSAKMTHLYHKLNFALIGLGPLALVLSPSAVSFPIDMALGVIIPLHSHVGGHDFITDYAHKISKAHAFENGARLGLLGVTAVMFAGLLKLNMQGPGITASIKAVWQGPKGGQ